MLHKFMVSRCLLLLTLLSFSSATGTCWADTTDPSMKDTDKDGFIDGPDKLIRSDDVLLWKLGEDKNGNGKYDPEGLDGIPGTSDDETNPNNPSSHPAMKDNRAKFEYKEIASWHDADFDGIPDAQEDRNLNGIQDEGESNFNDEYYINKSSCHLSIQNVNENIYAYSYKIEKHDTTDTDIKNKGYYGLDSAAQYSNSYWKIFSDSLSPFADNIMVYVNYDKIAFPKKINEDRLVVFESDLECLKPFRRMPNCFSIDKANHQLRFRVNKPCIFFLAEEKVPVNIDSKECLRVSVNGKNGAFSSIQAALDNIWPGGKIIVSPGQYKENIVFPSWVGCKDIQNSHVILKSTYNETGGRFDDNRFTYICGGEPDPVIQMYGDEAKETIIEGLTITNGDCRYLNGGGGICGNRTKATIRYNRIRFNESDFHGGGLSECDGDILYNLIDNNCASRKNGVSPSGGGVFSCNGLLQNNTIVYNNLIAYDSATGENSLDSIGGGLASCKNGKIKNCIIYFNDSWALSKRNISDCSSALNNCILEAEKSLGKDNYNVKPVFRGSAVGNYIADKMETCSGVIGSDGEASRALYDFFNTYIHIQVAGSGSNFANIVFSWSAAQDTHIKGYRLYASDKSEGVYFKINDGDVISGTACQKLINSSSEDRFYIVSLVYDDSICSVAGLCPEVDSKIVMPH